MFDSFFSKFSKKKRSSGIKNPDQWLIDYFGGGDDTLAGREVSEDNALAMSTVFACVTLISEAIASLPLKLYRQQPDGGRQIPNSQLYRLVHSAPNPEMSSFDWRLIAMGHLLLWGNCYSLIERNRMGAPIALWPIVPHRVSIKRKNNNLIYYISTASGDMRPYQQEDILHVKGFGYNGLAGQSVISFAREAVGLGLAAEEFGARFFGNGANPGLILEHPGKLSVEAQKNLREAMSKNYSGLGKSHKVMITEEGMKTTALSVPPGDAQFIELRGFQREEICSIFKVPPHMIGLLNKSTSFGKGIEQQQIGFVVNTLRPWLVRWEQSMAMRLLSDTQQNSGYFFEFIVDGLLRGDIKTRYDAYRIGRQWGWLSVNDIRKLENKNPVNGGEQYLSPMNMVPLEDAGKIKPIKDKQPPGQASGTDQGGADKEKKSCDCEHESRFFDVRTDNLPEDKDVAGILSVAKKNHEPVIAAFQDLAAKETTGLRAAFATDKLSPVEARKIIDEFYKDMPATIKRKVSSAVFRYQDDVSSAAQKMIGKGGGGKELRKELEKFKENYIGSLSKRYTGDSIKQIETVIRGANANDLISALNLKLAEWDAERGARYADEELVRAGNAMARETWARSGIVKLQWVSRGAKTCPFCKQLNGKIVGIEKPFLEDSDVLYASDGKNWMAMNGKKMHPPIHRGCVCAIKPISE